jgi:hypothetical protein
LTAASASTPNTSTPAVEHPLRNPHFRLLLIGGTISFLGDQFYMVALPWLILQQTGSAVVMGEVMMAGSIPRALLMLMGGVVSHPLGFQVQFVCVLLQDGGIILCGHKSSSVLGNYNTLISPKIENNLPFL